MVCFKCRDYVSDPRLEKIRISQIESSGLIAHFPGMPIYQHEHDAETCRSLAQDCRTPSYKATTGLKGLINMGSTCFMSSIIQTIVHNPFIRDYFLSGHHLDCERGKDTCLSCCVGEIFQDFYTSTSTTGFGPKSLLTAAWRVKRSLAGYSEQDAHEFWQFLVHQIHKNDTKSNRYKFNKESTPALETNGNGTANGNGVNGMSGMLLKKQGTEYTCDCITHRVFSGQLQSTIICSQCSNKTVTVDPMMDLSLEIQEKRAAVNGKTPATNGVVPLATLQDCLSKFTKPEKLDVLYQCETCHKKTEVTKQLKIKKAPLTLAIQLKRFEHHLAVSTKIETHVDIPVMLDLSHCLLLFVILDQLTLVIISLWLRIEKAFGSSLTMLP
ncbi:unnamed protein product [Ambrosiozyma monospora]|uniref:Unnamed protein product n=1 Tax=Ambrosiozyma monospora TaxID=43982 RepID=A0ACB5TBY2_AMBMO|nr:unnamed protein product [Ambrosiozyma monospora]